MIARCFSSGVNIHSDTLNDWKDQTILMMEVPGLRVHDAQILVGAGIRNRKELAEGLFHSPSGGYDQDEHPYKEDGEMRGDAASAYIQKREMGG